MKNRQKLILGIIIGLVIVIFIAFMALIITPSTPSGLPSPTVKTINPQGDTVLFSDDRFSITFQPQFNKYLILIKQTPFETISLQAESIFLQITSLAQQQACNQRVVITTTVDVDSALAGQEFNLSFCSPQTSPSPPLPTINPLSTPLSVVDVFPEQGKVEIANTRAAISVKFNQSVKPQTVTFSISPPLNASSTVRQDDTTQAIIIPKSKWQTNTTYQITLNAGIASSDGKSQLLQPLVLRYEVIDFAFPVSGEGE